MRFFDLFAMSVNSLRRRKLRTLLTVLGVVIGTASIVVMVSLGIGLKEMTMEQYASYGSLTQIQVYGNNYWGGETNEDSFLVDKKITEFSRIPHVSAVSPVLTTYIDMRQGAYSGGTQLTGVSRVVLEEIKLGEGRLPDSGASTMELVVGGMVARNFYNTKTGKGFWDTQEIPDVDLYNRQFFVTFQSSGGNDKVSEKKYIFPVSGMVEQKYDEDGNMLYNEYGYGVYTDIEQMKEQLRRIYRKNPIPGQPTNKKGKPYNYFIYDQAYVYVDDMDNVTAVQEAINEMGFETYSNMQWLEQAQQQMDMIQAVLGGIGAVSLFVAAIGIANTMMMSIYERTKEIGVLKVLGCALGDIRSMFLMEAGFIGFLGGTVGLLLSYGVSQLVNQFLGASLMGMASGEAVSISRIPIELSAAAVVFAILIGMLAGLFPALRAMKLSPLAAIRNE
ncbi:MAG: ABC transporter permease [Lachnospiraceae bacterium]|nr:ABC transporter permease [Lachnospiraceae bacterium]